MQRPRVVFRILCVVAAVTWTAGCANTAAYLVDRARAEEAAPVATPEMVGGYGGHSASPAAEGPSADRQTVVELAALTDTTQPSEQRILIYTAGLDVTVADVAAALANAQKIAESVGGYLQAMSADTITVRIPAKQFFAVLDQIQALGQTLSKDIEALDVTDEYVDLKLRLKNAEAMRDRLLAILEKAETVKDMLEVERELNRVRGEIEQIKGRLAVLEKQVVFSTVRIRFVKASARAAAPALPETPFPWLNRLGVETVLRIGQQ